MDGERETKMKQRIGRSGRHREGGSEITSDKSSEGEKKSGCKEKEERKQERAVGVEFGGLCDAACALFSDTAVCHGPTVTN